MKDLLRLEFRKLKRQKSFYICLGIMIAMILISGITAKIFVRYASQIAEISNGEEQLPISAGEFMLGMLSASSFSMISAIFVAIVVCGDYESQIIKNIYAKGYSRGNYYFSKMIYVFVATTIMFVSIFAASTLLGAVLFGTDGIEGKVFLLVAIQYVVAMAEVSAFFALSSALKKLGGSIAVGILAPLVISLLLELADTALKIKDFKVASVWLSSFTSDLTNIAIGPERIAVCAALSVVYAVLFIWAGFAINRKTEV